MKNFKLKIGGHKINIEFVDPEVIKQIFEEHASDELKKDSYPMGCYISPDKILICNELKGTFLLSILNHEVMELMNDLYDLKLSHNEMSIISEVFTQIVLDNKKIIIELLERK